MKAVAVLASMFLGGAVTIQPQEAARIGDYRGELDHAAPAFKAFTQKYSGKVVTMTGEVHVVGREDASLHLLVSHGKSKANFYCVLHDKGKANEVYEVLANARRGGYRIQGTITGKAFTSPDGKGFRLDECIYSLKARR